MSAQFGRLVSLIVGTDTEALDLSDMHFTFQTRQQDVQTPGVIDIRVYNLSDDTARKIAGWLEFGRLVLQAGYEGNFGSVFEGSLVQVRQGNERVTDSYVDITAVDGDEGFVKSIISTVLTAGSKPFDHFALLGSAIQSQNVGTGYVDQLPETQLSRGKVFFGYIRDCLTQVADNADCDWHIQDGKLNVVRTLAFLPGEIVVLTSATGLLGYPERNMDGIHISCLLNPAIKQSRIVQINNAGIQDYQLSTSISGIAQNSYLPKLDSDGYYRTLVISHQGDTRGNNWQTSMICVGLNQPPPNALVGSLVIKDGV